MNVIETHSITKYYGKSRGIIDVDLEIAEGEIFGFIGPNGAGKSTTIRTLLGLIRPTSGNGSIFGLDIVKDTKTIKKKLDFYPLRSIFTTKGVQEFCFDLVCVPKRVFDFGDGLLSNNHEGRCFATYKGVL
jgi:ABC-type uncharacterized transport system ATPase subunit